MPNVTAQHTPGPRYLCLRETCENPAYQDSNGKTWAFCHDHYYPEGQRQPRTTYDVLLEHALGLRNACRAADSRWNWGPDSERAAERLFALLARIEGA